MYNTITFHARIGEDGRIVIPAPVRRELGLKPGDTVVAESDGHSLLLRSYDQVVKDTQNFFRQFIPPGTSLVDELIADRRAESAREEANAETWAAKSTEP
ncbi:MAG TPA: AbrB/MazE/SpoVT family DNA-binding domain-containing protein [Urbifossiella sp.]|jgi:AbrB family looped-hinge helix DNA binding protein|nr:AbrB/MazE/SpoVT family DNA-binding domain-containing protein [Urbifossiella sp.]